ncbi:MAG: molybdenum cofactor biosynthesis protein MoaE [Candidatus Obscuribacterales bacterium]|nr:molybdenum cofactor biosynthesis protein MoaE [Candidatus Obscuribacterales bacterium]
MFKLTDIAIDPSALTRALKNDAAGAVVTFEGRVRDHNDGKAVDHLVYESYEKLAAKEAEAILKEARERYPVLEAHCVHRVGKLEIGEVAVWVAVASAHRKEAFDACEFIIDSIKHRLPIWKKETYSDGSYEWVNCRHEAEAVCP